MRLTERDFDLLRYLAEQGVASARQLTMKFFPSQQAFHSRMHQLVGDALVESLPLTTMREFSHKSYFETATDLLGSSRTDIWKYKIYRLGPRFKKKWPSTRKLSEVHMWRHQLMLNELRAVFEKKFPAALFLNDIQVTEEWRRWQHWGPHYLHDVAIPDLTVRVNDLKIAVEVERNQKTENKYYLRFIDYEKSDHTHVIYYCESERIFRMISKLAGRDEWMAVARFGTIHEVYRFSSGWIKLDEFLAERVRCEK